MLCFVLFIGFFSDVHLNADVKHDTLSVRCGTASAAVACNGDILVSSSGSSFNESLQTDNCREDVMLQGVFLLFHNCVVDKRYRTTVKSIGWVSLSSLLHRYREI